MADKDQINKLSQLFLEAGQAHHQAYIETDGDDPEWPIWYADYLVEKLPDALGHELTRSEIVYYLVLLSKEQQDIAPEIRWSDYYAGYILEQYESAESDNI